MIRGIRVMLPCVAVCACVAVCMCACVFARMRLPPKSKIGLPTGNDEKRTYDGVRSGRTARNSSGRQTTMTLFQTAANGMCRPRPGIPGPSLFVLWSTICMRTVSLEK